MKLIAILCVISWSGFWAFGYLALSASTAETSQIITAMLLAALGLFSGIFTWLKLARRYPGEWQRVTPPQGV